MDDNTKLVLLALIAAVPGAAAAYYAYRAGVLASQAVAQSKVTDVKVDGRLTQLLEQNTLIARGEGRDSMRAATDMPPPAPPAPPESGVSTRYP